MCTRTFTAELECCIRTLEGVKKEHSTSFFRPKFLANGVDMYRKSCITSRGF